MGPLWLDVQGYELTAEDKNILEHPTVGGVILFTRNYHDHQQLIALNHAIRKAAKGSILIGVDQEGGRVQRFREGFSLIPAAQKFAKQDKGEQLAQQAGWLMASELIAHDIDLSFAPVLDKGHQCKAIGNRSFGDTVEDVICYSSAYMQGMKAAGMATTGKHFPGHGGVIADSHLETPYDQRTCIAELDMMIFRHHIQAGLLDAMMPAHVIYPHYDTQPASGSEYWLKDVLRQELKFNGLIFSDDLSMESAAVMGSPAERAQQAMNAGCDMLLVCNQRQAQIEVLDNLPIQAVPIAERLIKRQTFNLAQLKQSVAWKQASESMKRMIDLS